MVPGSYRNPTAKKMPLTYTIHEWLHTSVTKVVESDLHSDQKKIIPSYVFKFY